MSEVLVAVIVYGLDSSNLLIELLAKHQIKFVTLLPAEKPTVVPTHIILSGGPKHVYQPDHYQLADWIIASRAPTLGICYGMQLIAQTFGGLVGPMEQIEKGAVVITEIVNHEVVTNPRWMNRLDLVYVLPEQFTITGVNERKDIMAFTDHHKWWAVQYHPEAPQCYSPEIILNFLAGQL